ncbi:MAG: cytoplasmic protein, partial [Lentisphaerae bacterium]|nr:cytoplasmic protein [Lentisphaerota bacterium]
MSPDNFTDKLLEEILVDAYSEDEQLWAFWQVIKDEVPLPAEGTVIGETVQVTKIDYDGNPQRGLRATCGKGDGKPYEVALEDVEFSEESRAASYAKAYRQWLGVPQPAKTRRAEFREKIKQTKVQVGEIDLDKPADLVVLGIKQGESARCRLIGKDKELTLRASGLWKVMPGEIVTVMPKKHWSFAGHPYLSADITGIRFDLATLGLTPLELNQFGMWDPAEHYWGEDDEPEEDWEKEIKAAGPRPEYEMAKIVPGEGPADFDSDPILEAVELKDAGDPTAADQLLNGLLIADLRCLDAHAHLGNLAFDHSPETALRHYGIGVQ